MVYESDFYTTRRPYTRPYVSSYSVTDRPFALPLSTVIQLRSIPRMPYVAHKRLVTVIHMPYHTVYHGGYDSSRSLIPIRVHARVRPSVLAHEINRIRNLWRPSTESYTEKYLQSKDRIYFDDEAREIRAKVDSLLRRVHVFVPRAVASDFLEEIVPERMRSGDYVRRLLSGKNIAKKDPEPISWYEVPERGDFGTLACVKYVAGNPQSVRRPYFKVADLRPSDIKNDVNFLSYYKKNRQAAATASPDGPMTERELRKVRALQPDMDEAALKKVRIIEIEKESKPEKKRESTRAKPEPPKKEAEPEPEKKPAKEPEVIKAAEPEPEPVKAAEPESEPVKEPEPEPAPEPVKEPEPAPKPARESAKVPKAKAKKAAAAPAPAPAPEPAPAPAPEPVVELVAEPVVETAPEPAPEPVPEPVAEPVAEPVVESAPEPAPEPVAEEKQPEPEPEVKAETAPETASEPAEVVSEAAAESQPEDKNVKQEKEDAIQKIEKYLIKAADEAKTLEEKKQAAEDERVMLELEELKAWEALQVAQERVAHLDEIREQEAAAEERQAEEEKIEAERVETERVMEVERHLEEARVTALMEEEQRMIVEEHLQEVRNKEEEEERLVNAAFDDTEQVKDVDCYRDDPIENEITDQQREEEPYEAIVEEESKIEEKYAHEEEDGEMDKAFVEEPQGAEGNSCGGENSIENTPKIEEVVSGGEESFEWGDEDA